MNIIVKFAPQDHAIINYTNWKGITTDRKIQPLHIWFGTTEHHKTPQFLLNAIDLDKDAERDFAMYQIHSINVFIIHCPEKNGIIKNNKSELVQEDYIFDPAAACGAGSKF